MPGSALITADVMDDHPVWGRCVFLQATGDAETIRGEYTERADEWPPLHFAIVEPPTDATLDPWYRLGFAQMHAYGMGESGGGRVEAPGVTIRPGGPDDLETAMQIDRLIHDAQAAAPSFSAVPLDDDGRRKD